MWAWATHRLHQNSSCFPTERQVIATVNILQRKASSSLLSASVMPHGPGEMEALLSLPSSPYSVAQRSGAYTLLYVFIKIRTFLRHIFNFMQQCGFVKPCCFLCFLFTLNLGKRFKMAKLRFQDSKLFFKVQQFWDKTCTHRYRLKQGLFCLQTAWCKLSWADH